MIASPLLLQAVGSLLRWMMAFLAGYAVETGIWSAGEADQYVSAAAIWGAVALVSLAWSLWNKYVTNDVIKQALAAPQGSERSVLKPKTPIGVITGTGAGMLFLVLGVGLLASGCFVKPHPDTTPEGKVAIWARQALTVADFGLTALEDVVDQRLAETADPVEQEAIREQARLGAGIFGQVGSAGQELATALRVSVAAREALGSSASASERVLKSLEAMQIAIGRLKEVITDNAIVNGIAAAIGQIQALIDDVARDYRPVPG